MATPVPAKTDTVKVILDMDRDLVSGLDAIVQGRGEASSRTALITELVRRAVEDEVRKAKIMQRLTRGTEFWVE